MVTSSWKASVKVDIVKVGSGSVYIVFPYAGDPDCCM